MIADPGLHSSVYPDACSDIRVRPGTRTTPEICPSLNGAGEVAAQAAVARGCADGGSGLIAPAGSGPRRLRQTQWHCRNADRNYSKFNRCNLSHIIFPPSHVVLGLNDVAFSLQNILLTQIRRYCARGGFFSATVEVIRAPSFEIAWKLSCAGSVPPTASNSRPGDDMPTRSPSKVARLVLSHATEKNLTNARWAPRDSVGR